VDKLTGILVDTKLLAIDALEALAGVLRVQAGGGGGGSRQQGRAGGAGKPDGGGRGGSGSGGGGSSSAGDEAGDEVRMLLIEAELLAGELYAD
jgi:hypothetical protein